MNQLLMLKGLPASGKTTYAKQLLTVGNWKRVNKDDLRAMLDNYRWSKQNEKFVLELRDKIISDALYRGLNVVVDDTNFNPKHEEDFLRIAEMSRVGFEVKFFDTPIEDCIERDLKRPVSVGERVIRQMYDQYLKPKPEVYVPPTDKPWAVLCDIDGTLAHGIGVTRKPYEWDKVETDTIDPVVADLLTNLYSDGVTRIILMSGRDGSCRGKTEDWLHKMGVPYDHLHMREEGDNRKDFIIKRELFDKHIRNDFEVSFVLDDRNQVVDMWRQMGLKVFQVAEGDF